MSEKNHPKKDRRWRKSKLVEALLFFAPASLIIIGALIVIFARNPVHNAMGLVMTLVKRCGTLLY